MKMKLALMTALLMASGLFVACADTQKVDDGFSQSTTEYDTVLQTDHDAKAWKKISREPSAISTPVPMNGTTTGSGATP